MKVIRTLAVVAALLTLTAAALPVAFANAASIVLLHSVMRTSKAAIVGVRYAPPAPIPASDAARATRWLRFGNGEAATSMNARVRMWSRDQAGAAVLFESMPARRRDAALLAGNARAAVGDSARAVRDWEAATVTPLERLSLAQSLYGQDPDPWGPKPEHCRDAIAVLEATAPMADPALRARFTGVTADIYDSMDDEVAALRVLDRRLAEAPDDVRAADRRLIVLERMNAMDRLVVAANETLARRPSWAAYLTRGAAFLQQCRVTEALHDFESGLQLPRPDDYRYSWLRMRLGAAEWELGNRAAAIAEWRRYAAEQPGPEAQTIIADAEAGTRPTRCAGRVR